MRAPIPFGRYLLLERISVGGMAEIFKAKAFGIEGFSKVVAVKRILPSMVDDQDFIQMFIDEAKIAGQLNHANICQIFELGKIEDTHFIAMEYVWGKDLLQIQNRFRRSRQIMPVAQACLIGARMCAGLDYVHRKRDLEGKPLAIVHRDVSPQNVLVSYEGEVKLIDFGIAKAQGRSSRTQAGVLKGKFGYMSPEQVRGLPMDRRSDVFSVGTLLYEMLSGHRLFIGDSDFATLEKIRNADIIPVTRLNPDVPVTLERIVTRSLARDPEDRYQWASELQDELLALLAQQEPIYGSTQLSAWMHEVFATEMRREQEAMERYRLLGPDGTAVSESGRRELPGEHAGGAEDDADATIVGGPEFEDVLEAGGAASPVVAEPAVVQAVARLTAPRPSASDFEEEKPTEVYFEDEHPAKLAREPTYIFDERRPLADLATFVFAPGAEGAREAAAPARSSPAAAGQRGRPNGMAVVAALLEADGGESETVIEAGNPALANALGSAASGERPHEESTTWEEKGASNGDLASKGLSFVRATASGPWSVPQAHAAVPRSADHQPEALPPLPAVAVPAEPPQAVGPTALGPGVVIPPTVAPPALGPAVVIPPIVGPPVILPPLVSRPLGVPQPNQPSRQDAASVGISTADSGPEEAIAAVVMAAQAPLPPLSFPTGSLWPDARTALPPADEPTERVPSGRRNVALDSTDPVPPMPYLLPGSWQQRGLRLFLDVLIGMGVALIVLTAILGVRELRHRSVQPRPRLGTLVVKTTPAAAAEVLVDGVLRGRVEREAPFTLRDVPPGMHVVLVRAEAIGEVTRRLEIRAGEVGTVHVAFPQVDLSGRLRLRLSRPGANVYLDGSQVPEELLKDALVLRSGVMHEVRVVHPSYPEVLVSVMLAPGEQQVRDVDIGPPSGLLDIRSTPSGADVYLDGRRRGTTPLVIDDVDIRQVHRVTLRRAGWVPVVRDLRFAPGSLRSALDVSLEQRGARREGTQPRTGRTSSRQWEPAPPTIEAGSDTLDGQAGDTAPPGAGPPGAGPPGAGRDAGAAAGHGGGQPPAPPPSSHVAREVVSDNVGHLVAGTSPRSRVFVDGHDTGRTTPIEESNKLGLRPGRHVVTFVVGDRRFSFDVIIRAGEVTSLVRELDVDR